MNVLLVQAGRGHGARAVHATQQPPLGLCYIASYLKRAGHAVRGIDLFWVDTLEDLREALSAQPDVVGVSFQTNLYGCARTVIEATRALCPRALVVVGGPHATFQMDQVLADLAPDAVVPMEGELVMVELVQALAEGRTAGSVQGVRTVDNVFVPGAYVRNLDELPLPDREAFNWPKYGALWHRLRKEAGAAAADQVLTLVGHRGCPMSCRFCVAPAMRKVAKLRARSNESLVAEIGEVCERYGTRSFMLMDELFTQNHKSVRDFADRLGRLNTRFHWSCEARVDKLDEALMRLLVEAGCHGVQIGLEAADNESLRAIGKHTTIEQIIDVAAAARRVGLQLVGNIIVGLPTDTEALMRPKFDLAKQLTDLGVKVSFSYLIPYPGTDYYERREHYGIVIENDNWDDYSFGNCVLSTRHLTRDQIVDYATALQDFVQQRSRLNSMQAALHKGIAALER